MNPINKLYGVVLAGGKSSRMGQDKASLQINNETMLERSIKLLQSIGVDEVLISKNQDGYLQDVYPDRGPMSGIHSALVETKSVLNDTALIILPIDMPLLDKTILDNLVSCGKAMHCALHFCEHQLPLFLPNNAESREFAGHVVKSAEDRSIRRFLNIINGTRIKTSMAQKLVNTNNMEQWQQAVKLLA